MQYGHNEWGGEHGAVNVLECGHGESGCRPSQRLANRLASVMHNFGYMPNGRLGVVVGQEPVQTGGGGQWTKQYQIYESWSLYDHQGQRLSKTVYSSSGMQTRLFFHDPQGRLVSEICLGPALTRSSPSGHSRAERKARR